MSAGFLGARFALIAWSVWQDKLSRKLSFGTNGLSESVSAVANVGPPVLPVNAILIDQSLFLEERARASCQWPWGCPPVPSSPVGAAWAQLTGKGSKNAAFVVWWR